ncbi:TolC family protein [Haoranjiania flava]|uniref:TolC family protein n=1 Tax=Haoranjiania flava TaxID=1856322 RepID=A0AAE3IQW8_9BACT|nr:TolC family protein [Haoranjiania flava]MCU7694756.1 TolC family protein [Haoranjiania flava]
MHKKYLSFFIATLPLFSIAQSGTQMQALTFGEAMQIMEKNHHALKQADYHVKEKQAERQARKGLYYPKVGISGNYVAMQKDVAMNLSPVRDALMPLYNTLGNYGSFSGVPNPDPATNKQMPVLPDNLSTKAVREKLLEGAQAVQNADWEPTLVNKFFGSVMATAQLPIYTGGKIHAANQAAMIEEQEAAEEVAVKKAELTSELAERYFGLKLAEQAILVRKQVLDGMNKHLEDARKMEARGMLARAEVLNAQVHQAQAEREYKKAVQTAAILTKAMANSLSVPELQIVPVTDLFYVADLEPVDYFKVSALQNNPQLKQVKTKMELARQGSKAERGALYPTVALIGSYNIVNASKLAPDWFAGIGAKWTLFDGYSRSNKIKAAAYKVEQVREAELKAINDINAVIDKLYTTLGMYKDQLEALEASQKLADEYLYVRQKGFEAEMNTTTDIMDAHLGVSKIKIEKLEAMYGFDKTLAELLKYAGMAEQFEEYRNSHQLVIGKF